MCLDIILCYLFSFKNNFQVLVKNDYFPLFKFDSSILTWSMFFPFPSANTLAVILFTSCTLFNYIA